MLQKTDLRPVRAAHPCDACGAPLDAGDEPLVSCPACRSTVIRGGRNLVISQDGDQVALSVEPVPSAVPMYQLGQFLGRGAFASVYAARHLPTGEQRAIKFLHASCPPEQIRRFRREVQLLKRAESRHILKVHELGTLRDHTYIALELVASGTLRDRLVQGGRLEVPEAVEIARQLAAGVEVLHQFEIIHRDLKPENVLVGAEVKIADLGIALDLRNQYPDEEAPGAVIGTPMYMAPEQMDGKPALQSDVYALGAIMHEMLTGIPPKFERAGRTRLLVPPSQHAPWLKGPIQQLLLSALAWDPKDRPKTAKVLRAALEELRPVHPVVSRRRELVAQTAVTRTYGRGWLKVGLLSAGMIGGMLAAAAFKIAILGIGAALSGVGALLSAERAGRVQVNAKGVFVTGPLGRVSMSWQSCRTLDVDVARGRFTFRYGSPKGLESGKFETLVLDAADLGTSTEELLGALHELTEFACPAVFERVSACRARLRPR